MSILHSIDYGETTIEYEVTFSDRTTLGISVLPDLTVEVVAPRGSDPDLIAAKVHKRAAWILRQRRDLEQYLPAPPPPEYVSGESHTYLGRRYRLKVRQSATTYETVKLRGGYIEIYARDKGDRQHIGELLEGWYRRHAERVLPERLTACFPPFERLGVASPPLKIRTMKTRWGSCTPAGTILLHPGLIKVPKRCIDYVITHEMCHLVEHHHGEAFYALLARIMPDWQQRKQTLNTFRLR
jgi:hypothetical protein